MNPKQNRLSHDQVEAVQGWLSEHWADVEARRLSRDTAAGLCSASVGFRVTAANIAGVCKRIGKTWPKTSTADQRLGYRIHLLRLAVAHLYREHGIEAPNEEIARLLDLPAKAEEEPKIQQPAGDARIGVPAP